MRFKKKLGLAVFAFVMATGLMLWIVQLCRPALLMDEVAYQLAALIHQDVKIQGGITWQIFPRPAIKMKDMQIGEQGKSYYTAKLDNLLFNLKITPLFKGQLVFNEVYVDGFHLDINPDVHFSEQSAHPQQSSNRDNNANFTIEHVLLSRGDMTLQRHQQTVKCSHIQLGFDPVNQKKLPFQIQLKTQVSMMGEEGTWAKGLLNFKGSTLVPPSFFDNPLLELEHIVLKGQLIVQKLKAKNIKINQLSANVTTNKGVLLLTPLTVNLYHGESVGDLAYELSTGQVTVNQTATNLNADKFLPVFLKNKWVSGSLDFSLHTTANIYRANWLNASTTKGNMTIKDGELTFINLDKLIDEMNLAVHQLVQEKKSSREAASLEQLNEPDAFKGSTPFKVLTFQYTMQNDTLQSDDLVLQTERLHFTGDSQFDVEQKRLNGRLFAKISFANTDLDKTQELLGGYFPLLMDARLNRPVITPDLKRIQSKLAELHVKKPEQTLSP